MKEGIIRTTQVLGPRKMRIRILFALTLMAATTVSAILIPDGACVVLSENFDGVTPPALPAGWVATNAQGPAPLWVTSNIKPDSAPNAALVDDAVTSAKVTLSSPEGEATGIPPTNDLESAIVRTLSPGAYTAVLRGGVRLVACG